MIEERSDVKIKRTRVDNIPGSLAALQVPPAPPIVVLPAALSAQARHVHGEYEGAASPARPKCRRSSKSSSVAAQEGGARGSANARIGLGVENQDRERLGEMPALSGEQKTFACADA